MAHNKLTDAAIRKAKPTDKTVRLSDGDGLSLEITATGRKWWRFKYRLAGKEKLLSMGTYPETPLEEARKRRLAARTSVAAGIDPSELRKAEKAQEVEQADSSRRADAGLPPAGSFEAVAREWLTTIHAAKVSEGHATRTRIRLEQDVFPWIGRRPIGEIEPPELLKCLRRVEARGAIETAHRAKDACGQVFRYGIAIGLCTRNAAGDLRDALRPVESKHLAAIVEPKRAGELLRDMMGYKGQPVTRSALALSALLLLRPGELRQAQWVDVDLEAALLTIPSERMKRKKSEKAGGPPHLVPLAPQAVELLRDLQVLTGHTRFVFPALTTSQRCMSENTVRSALRRLGYGNDDMTAHGFRAMARTMIAERLGVQPEIIEAQLAHAVAGPLGRAYDRTTYMDQRRDMMAKWADYIDRLRKGADVIPIRA